MNDLEEHSFWKSVINFGQLFSDNIVFRLACAVSGISLFTFLRSVIAAFGGIRLDEFQALYYMTGNDNMISGIIDLFCGIGGLSLGFEQAGFEVISAIDVWKDAGAIRYGVLYPMQTFSKGACIDWPDVPVFVEGCNPACMDAVTKLAHDLSGNVTPLSSKGRKKLHIAAVFACNFTNRMYAISEQLLATEGVPFSVMLPLVRETARKVESIKPHDAQTGPAVRGDRKVISEHLELLKDYPEFAELYRLISIDINSDLK